MLKVMPLGNHLGADHNIDFPGMHLFKGRLSLTLGAHAVTVNAQKPRLGPKLFNTLFNFLGPCADRFKFGVSAAGAVLRHLIGRAAVMTHQFFLSFMENRKPRAVPAAAHPAAGRAS